MRDYKILGSIWWARSEDNCIGIVAIESHAPTGAWKVYIGLGLGLDKDSDLQHIARTGMPLLHKDAVCAFFPRLDPEKYMM